MDFNMPAYTTSLSNIRQLFKDQLQELHQQFKSQDINQALLQIDIFQNHDKTDYQNQISQLAWLIGNSDYQNLKIAVENGKPQCQSMYELLALDISGKEHVVVVSDSNLAESNSEFIEMPENKDDESPQEILFYEAHLINWDSLGAEDSPWENPEFVLDKIRAQKGYGANFEEIFTYADLKLWQNKEFMQEALKINEDILERAPVFIALNNSILDVAKSDAKIFSKILISHYIKVCYYEGSDDYYSYDSPKKNLERAIKDNEPEKKIEFLKWHIEKNKKIYDRLHNEVFSDINFVKSVLEHTTRIYDVCPEHVRADRDLATKYVKKTLSGSSNYGLESNIPQSLFDNDDDFMTFYIQEASKRSADFKGSNAYASWLDNKEKLLKFLPLSNVNHNNKDSDPPEDHLLFIFNKINKKFKTDMDVMRIFLNKDSHLYNRLSEVMRKQPELIEIYIKNEPEYIKYTGGKFTVKEKSFEKLPQSFIESLDIEKDLPKIITVAKSMPELLLSDRCPASWLKNPDILACSGQHFQALIDKYQFSEDMIARICHTEQNALYLIKQKSENYFIMNYDARKRETNVLEVLDRIYYFHDKNKHLVPKEVFCSQKVWLKLIRNKNEFINELPENFWHDKNFILAVAKLIDKEQFNVSHLNKGPAKIAQLIDQGKPGKKNYYSFFKKCISSASLHNDLINNQPDDDDEPVKMKI
jgi:hypothetical protein